MNELTPYTLRPKRTRQPYFKIYSLGGRATPHTAPQEGDGCNPFRSFDECIANRQTRIFLFSQKSVLLIRWWFCQEIPYRKH